MDLKALGIVLLAVCVVVLAVCIVIVIVEAINEIAPMGAEGGQNGMALGAGDGFLGSPAGDGGFGQVQLRQVRGGVGGPAGQVPALQPGAVV
jgi:hypothetical protein